MPAMFKRMTFTVTPEMEAPLDSFKKEIFYYCNESEMICELLSAGIRAKNNEKKVNEQEQEKSA